MFYEEGSAFDTLFNLKDKRSRWKTLNVNITLFTRKLWHCWCPLMDTSRRKHLYHTLTIKQVIFVGK